MHEHEVRRLVVPYTVRVSLLSLIVAVGFICNHGALQAMEVNCNGNGAFAMDSCRLMLIPDVEDEFDRFPDWGRNIGDLRCTTLNTHYMSAGDSDAKRDKGKALLAAFYRDDCGRFMFRFQIRERGSSRRWRDVGSGCVMFLLDVSEGKDVVSVLNEHVEGCGVKFKVSAHGDHKDGGWCIEVCVSHFSHRDVCYYRVDAG